MNELQTINREIPQRLETALDVVKNGGVTLFCRAKEKGLVETAREVKMRLMLANNNSNVARKMTNEQIDMAVNEVMSQYKFFTLEDIDLVLRKGILGEYGELYESMSPSKVINWFRHYDIERDEAIVQMRIEEKREREAMTADDWNSVNEWYSAVKKQADKPQEPKKPTPTEAENRQRSVSLVANTLLNNGTCATMIDAIECAIKQLER